MFTEKEVSVLETELKQGEQALSEEERQLLPELIDRLYKTETAYWEDELTPQESAQWEALKQEIDAQNEREEERLETLTEEAITMQESPFIEGEWAQIRRSFLQRYEPMEWVRLVKSREASPYLKQIEATYQSRFRQMYAQEEQRKIAGKSLTFLEAAQEASQIKASIREILTDELSH